MGESSKVKARLMTFCLSLEFPCSNTTKVVGSSAHVYLSDTSVFMLVVVLVGSREGLTEVDRKTFAYTKVSRGPVCLSKEDAPSGEDMADMLNNTDRATR